MMMFSLMKPFTVKVYWTFITEISAYLSKPFNIEVFLTLSLHYTIVVSIYMRQLLVVSIEAAVS